MKKKEKDIGWGKAIVQVLAKSSEPMHYIDIVEQILQDGLRSKGNIGARPSFTVNSILNKDIKSFEKVGKGIFRLRKGQSSVQIPKKIKKEIESEGNTEAGEIEEETSGIIRAFGMYWVRDNITWSSKPKLYGTEHEDAQRVDFSGQKGIYLLHDGSRVIYVGRTTDRSLGRRLYEHTLDRHNGRWNRFSWFGTLAVDNNGKLVEKNSGTFSAEQCIIAMEAIFIEGLEPPQNRRAGDGIGTNEFIQIKDPGILKKELKRQMDDLIDNAV